MKKAYQILVPVLVLMNPNSVIADICDIAKNTSSRVAFTLTTASAVAGGGLKAAGVSAVVHSSGATILTASSGYVGGTIGVIGTVGSVLASPVTLVLGGLTLIGAGGVYVYCNQ